MSHEQFWLSDNPDLWNRPVVDKENGVVIERARPGDGHIFVDLQGTVMEEAYPIYGNPEAVRRYNVTRETMHEFVGNLRERKDALYWDGLLDTSDQQGWIARTDDKDRVPVGFSIGAPRADITLQDYSADSPKDASYSVREICALYVLPNGVKQYRRQGTGGRLTQFAMGNAHLGVVRLLPWIDAGEYYRNFCAATITRKPVEIIKIGLSRGRELIEPQLAGVLPGRAMLSEDVVVQECLRFEALGQYVRALRDSGNNPLR